jgi:hypothetical protein
MPAACREWRPRPTLAWLRPAAFAAVTILTGCVAHEWAPGPGLTAADFEPAKARCSLAARHSDSGFAAVGSPAFVGVSALGAAIGNTARAQQDFNDCMLASGWRIADEPQTSASSRGASASNAVPEAPASPSAPVPALSIQSPAAVATPPPASAPASWSVSTPLTRAPETQIRRSVPGDVESMVSSSSLWLNREGQCRANHIPALELLRSPQHGTVRFATVEVGIPKGSGCANAVAGQGVFYRPAPGFVGQDQFTYNVPTDAMTMDWVGGPPPTGPRTVILTVSASSPSSLPGTPVPASSSAVLPPSSAPQPTPRTVASGERQRIGYFYYVNPDCSSGGYMTVRILTPPGHGEVTTDRGLDYPNYSKENQRYQCNLKQSPVSNVLYKSNSGYVGTDSFLIEAVSPLGSTITRIYQITVR